MTLITCAVRTFRGPPARRIVTLGFSLLELMFAVAALGVLSVIAVPAYTTAIDHARIDRAIGDIGGLQLKIAQFELAQGRLPTSLGEIGQAALLDPWGEPYQYLDFTGRNGNGHKRKDRSLNPLNSDYDLGSNGKDGRTNQSLRPPVSHDDIIRAGNGSFIGKAEDF